MTNEQNLEQKLDEIETKMPGISEKIKKDVGSLNYRGPTLWTGGYDGSTGRIDDVAYLDTGKYHVIVTLTDFHRWGATGGGIAYIDIVNIYYQKKEHNASLKEATFSVSTRHQYNPANDRLELLACRNVSVSNKSDSTISISTKSDKGNIGYETEINLDLIPGPEYTGRNKSLIARPEI